MKFIDIKSSQDIEKYFVSQNVQSLYEFASIDNRTIRIGYQLLEDKFIIKLVAIQLINTPTYEMYELFDADNIACADDIEVKAIALSFSDEMIDYNNAILRFYKNL